MAVPTFVSTSAMASAYYNSIYIYTPPGTTIGDKVIVVTTGGTNGITGLGENYVTPMSGFGEGPMFSNTRSGFIQYQDITAVTPAPLTGYYTFYTATANTWISGFAFTIRGAAPGPPPFTHTIGTSNRANNIAGLNNFNNLVVDLALVNLGWITGTNFVNDTSLVLAGPNYSPISSLGIMAGARTSVPSGNSDAGGLTLGGVADWQVWSLQFNAPTAPGSVVMVV